MKFTLITGASQGMGKEMARECALLKRNVILVSLPNENVADVAAEIAAEFNVVTAFYECDLTIISEVEALYNWTQSQEYQIDFLINNAGFGGVGAFDTYSLGYINKMLDLNVKATTNMTHFFVPELKKNAPAYLLNNASMVANFPVPYKSIYAASKVYVRSFTRALREELKPFNVKVSVLQPGATPTNNVVKTQIETGGFFAKISVSSVQDVARKAIRDTIKGRAVITPGFKNRVSLCAIKLFPPALLQIIMARQVKGMKEK